MHTQYHSLYAEIRRQLARVGSQELNSGYWAWPQEPFISQPLQILSIRATQFWKAKESRMNLRHMGQPGMAALLSMQTPCVTNDNMTTKLAASATVTLG